MLNEITLNKIENKQQLLNHLTLIATEPQRMTGKITNFSNRGVAGIVTKVKKLPD